MQVIALAERGTLYDPGPCMYMEKIAVGPRVAPDAVSLDYTVKENLAAVSKALGKPVKCVLTSLPIPFTYLIQQLHSWFTCSNPLQSSLRSHSHALQCSCTHVWRRNLAVLAP